MTLPIIPGDLILPEPRDDRERELYRTLQDWTNSVRVALLAISYDLESTPSASPSASPSSSPSA